MAIYQGARPRSFLDTPLAPGRLRPSPPADAPARRRVRGAVRARRRGQRMPVLIGAIVLGFLLAFFSLAQTVRVSATSYDLDRLATEREQLDNDLRVLQSDLNRLGREPAIRKLSIDAGLGQLAEPLVLPSR